VVNRLKRQQTKTAISKSVAAIFILAGIVVLVSFGFPESEREIPLPSPNPSGTLRVAPEQGSLAPGFSLENTRGEIIDLSDFLGRPVLINFWATWCAPCRIEMPFIQDRYDTYQEDGLAVLAINFDEPKEDVAYFRNELGLTFDLLLDPGGEIQGLYQILGYPTSYFVDQNGVIQALHIGVMTEGQLDDYLEQIGLAD
jgi:peroxiredoxin